MQTLNETTARLVDEYGASEGPIWPLVRTYRAGKGYQVAIAAENLASGIEKLVTRCVAQGYIAGRDEERVFAEDACNRTATVMLSMADQLTDLQLALWALKNANKTDFPIKQVQAYIAERESREVK